jgi:hypothetical protein
MEPNSHIEQGANYLCQCQYTLSVTALVMCGLGFEPWAGPSRALLGRAEPSLE